MARVNLSDLRSRERIPAEVFAVVSDEEDWLVHPSVYMADLWHKGLA